MSFESGSEEGWRSLHHGMSCYFSLFFFFCIEKHFYEMEIGTAPNNISAPSTALVVEPTRLTHACAVRDFQGVVVSDAIYKYIHTYIYLKNWSTVSTGYCLRYDLIGMKKYYSHLAAVRIFALHISKDKSSRQRI